MEQGADTHRRIVWALALTGLVALPLAYPIYDRIAAPNADWITRSQNHFGLDFVNFWSGGRLAREGLAAAGYDPVFYKALLASWFAPATRFVNLSYPPSLLPWLATTPLLAVSARSEQGVQDCWSMSQRPSPNAQRPLRN